MKRMTCVVIATASTCALAQTPASSAQRADEDCGPMIAVLPTFDIPEMKDYLQQKPEAGGKDIAQKLRALSDAGNKTAQFTYGTLLLAGYCVPQDLCAGKKLREQSRGGAKDWEQFYPIPPFLKDKYDKASCS